MAPIFGVLRSSLSRPRRVLNDEAARDLQSAKKFVWCVLLLFEPSPSSSCRLLAQDTFAAASLFTAQTFLVSTCALIVDDPLDDRVSLCDSSSEAEESPLTNFAEPIWEQAEELVDLGHVLAWPIADAFSPSFSSVADCSPQADVPQAWRWRSPQVIFGLIVLSCV